MTAVYLVRHPQTTWNVGERYQGRLEAPLSQEGEKQQRLLCQTFQDASLDAVYSSPLQRSLCLAEQLAHLVGCMLTIDERLTEMALGPWEGLYKSEIQEAYPQLFEEWYARPERVRFPSGESAADVQGRAQAVLADIVERHPSGDVVVITHSIVIQTLVAACLSLQLSQLHQIRLVNGGVTTVCATELPGTLFSLNSTDSLYGSPVLSAKAHGCAGWMGRRMTA